MHSRRRDFLALLGGATALPVASFAQGVQGQQKLVALIWALPQNDSRLIGALAAVLEGLREQGWIRGENVRVEFGFNGLVREVARANAQELAALNPDVFIAAGLTVTEEVLAAAGSTPIVFFAVVDPLGAGFVETLPRPGGNVTGFSNVDASLGGKWLDLLRQVTPGLSHAALMVNPQPGETGTHYIRSFQEAASSLRIAGSVVPVNSIEEITAAIDAVGAEPRGGLVVSTDAFLLIRRLEIVQAAARARVPAIYGYRDFVEEGGLISYSADPSIWLRGVGTYVGRILNGELAADLPVQFPSVFDLGINMRAAAELGITIPNALLALADHVVE